MRYFYHRFINVFLYMIFISKLIKTENDYDKNKFLLYKLEFKTLKEINYENVIYDDFEALSKYSYNFRNVSEEIVKIYQRHLLKPMHLDDKYRDDKYVSESIYKKFFQEKSDVQEKKEHNHWAGVSFARDIFFQEILDYVPCNLMSKWNAIDQAKNITSDYVEESDICFKVILDAFLRNKDYRKFEFAEEKMQILSEVLKKMPRDLRECWAKKIEKENPTFNYKKNKDILNLIIQLIFPRKHDKYCERKKNCIYNYTEEQEFLLFTENLRNDLKNKCVTFLQENRVTNIRETCKTIVDLIVASICKKYYYDVENYEDFMEYINENINWWKGSIREDLLIYEKYKHRFIKCKNIHIHIENDYFFNIDYLEEIIHKIYNDIEVNYLYIKYIKKNADEEIEISARIPNELKEKWIKVMKENRLEGVIKEDNELMTLVSQSIYALIDKEIENIVKFLNSENIGDQEKNKNAENVPESTKEKCVNKIKNFLYHHIESYPREYDVSKDDTFFHHNYKTKYGSSESNQLLSCSEVGYKSIDEKNEIEKFAIKSISKELMLFLASKCRIYYLEDYLKKREEMAFEINIFEENDYEQIECDKIASLIKSNSQKLSEVYIVYLHVLHCFGKEMNTENRKPNDTKINKNTKDNSQAFYESQMETYQEFINRIKKIYLLIMKDPKATFILNVRVTDSFYDFDKNMFEYNSLAQKCIFSKEKVEKHSKEDRHLKNDLELLLIHLKHENALKIPKIKSKEHHLFY